MSSEGRCRPRQHVMCFPPTLNIWTWGIAGCPTKQVPWQLFGATTFRRFHIVTEQHNCHGRAQRKGTMSCNPGHSRSEGLRWIPLFSGSSNVWSPGRKQIASTRMNGLHGLLGWATDQTWKNNHLLLDPRVCKSMRHKESAKANFELVVCAQTGW